MFFNVLIVPAVKFRFRPEDLGQFENDPDNAAEPGSKEGLAYRTKEKIGVEHIDLQGVLTQGLKGDILKRMKAHPVKVALGISSH